MVMIISRLFRRVAIGKTECAEAEEILPSGGGAENILPIALGEGKSTPLDPDFLGDPMGSRTEEAAEEQ